MHAYYLNYQHYDTTSMPKSLDSKYRPPHHIQLSSPQSQVASGTHTFDFSSQYTSGGALTPPAGKLHAPRNDCTTAGILDFC